MLTLPLQGKEADGDMPASSHHHAARPLPSGGEGGEFSLDLSKPKSSLHKEIRLVDIVAVVGIASREMEVRKVNTE